jgi:N-acetylmuramic acid 6-phosphate etherase
METGVTRRDMSATETISPLYVGLDSWDDGAVLDAFIEGQERAIAAVRAARPALTQAARAIVDRLGDTGRIVYVGAGSSGIIAALDGMELAGTFGLPEDRVVFVLASGDRIAPLAGGPEDDTGLGHSRMASLGLGHGDVVIAVAASGSTPFTLAAVVAAREAGALTVGLANNTDAALLDAVDIPVLLDSGPEVIVGSTRMGAGTAQKAALGMISSLAMIRLGHVLDGLMVNLKVDNTKLRRRAIRILVYLAGCEEAAAEAALDACNGQVKAAALVARGVPPEEARHRLSQAGDNLRNALAELS